MHARGVLRIGVNRGVAVALAGRLVGEGEGRGIGQEHQALALPGGAEVLRCC
jgi:hypothetical protein